MPKCVKCNDFFPPNYTDVIENSKPDYEGKYPQICIFCNLMVSEVDRETEHNSGKYVAYTKKECVKDYADFMKKLKDSKKVTDILSANNNWK
jgi:hypothetical protein